MFFSHGAVWLMSPNSWPGVSCALDGRSIAGLPVVLPGHQKGFLRIPWLAGLVSVQPANVSVHGGTPAENQKFQS